MGSGIKPLIGSGSGSSSTAGQPNGDGNGSTNTTNGIRPLITSKPQPLPKQPTSSTSKETLNTQEPTRWSPSPDRYVPFASHPSSLSRDVSLRADHLFLRRG